MYSILLKILEERKAFLRFFPFIKKHTVTEEVYKILLSMKESFEKDPSLSKIDWSSFIPFFKLHKIVGLSKEKHEIYQAIFDNIPSSLSGISTEGIIESFINKDYAKKISEISLSIADGDDTKTIEDLLPLINDYKEEIGEASKSESGWLDLDLDNVLEKSKKELFEWELEELNISAGPLREEQLIVIAAAPDAGKTTLLCQEAANIAKQIADDKSVVWFNNEESGYKVGKRIAQATVHWHGLDIQSDPIGFKNAINYELGGREFKDMFRFYSDKELSVSTIEERLKECKPAIIILDQLWKVHGFDKSFSEVQQMNRLFAWARKLGEKYKCPVIVAHQVDGTAQDIQYIAMHQLYMSRVAIQGEADIIITLGRTSDPAYKNTRFLFVPKNKNDPGGRMIESERNGRFEIEIKHEYAQFIGPYKKP